MTHVKLLELTSKSSFRKSSGGGVTIYLKSIRKPIKKQINPAKNQINYRVF